MNSKGAEGSRAVYAGLKKQVSHILIGTPIHHPIHNQCVWGLGNKQRFAIGVSWSNRSIRTFSVMWYGMVGAWPGQGGHQFSALNAAEEGPDLGAISISYQTVCVGVPMYHSLQTIGAWELCSWPCREDMGIGCLLDHVGEQWRLFARSKSGRGGEKSDNTKHTHTGLLLMTIKCKVSQPYIETKVKI